MFCLLLQFTCQAWALNWEQSAIAGEDANGDGVRDDVASFIDQHWQADDLRHWAHEAARASQAYLLSGGNRFALHRAHAFMERSRRCLGETHGPQVANTVINRVLRIQLDSYERKQRYKEAVDQWVHKVSREDLPQHPDDSWNPACGPGHEPASRVANIPQPQANAEDSELPPPNFFITRAMPKEPGNREASSASVKVRPLPTPPLPDAATGGDAAVTAPPTGQWTTYTPRPHQPQGTANPGTVDSRLPVRRLSDGEPPAVARREAAPVSTAPTRAAAPPRSHTVTSSDRLPPALRELAPFIRDVQQR